MTKIEAVRENVRAFKADTFKFHGEEAMKHLDNADTEICIMANSNGYVNVSAIRSLLARAKVEIEELIYPSNTDMEATILRNEGSDLRVEVK
jgi:hypothetical protein